MLLDEAGQQLFGQGILGVMVVILLVALRDIFKRLMDSHDKRINEAVENRTAIDHNTAAMTALTDIIKERRS